MSNLFKTSDFLTASTLIYFKQELFGLEKENPKRMIFCFTDNKETRKTLELFHKRMLAVEPNEFSDIQRSLKSRMFA